MLVKIINHDPSIVEKISELTKICYPSIVVEKLNKNETKRYYRKLVRQKNMILRSVHVLFEIRCPIAVYNELQFAMPDLKMSNVEINYNDMAFEIPNSFSDTVRSQVLSLFKKVKKILIDSDDDGRDLLYILPQATIIKCNVYLDFLEIYDLITGIKKANIQYAQTEDLTQDVFDLMCEKYPEFFTKQNLEIFMASKEK